MEVQVLDALARILAHIGDDAVAPVAAKLGAQPGDGGEDMAQQGPVLLGQRGGRGDVLFGDDEEMDRGLRVNVVKGQQRVVLVQLVGGDFPRGDFAEQAVFHAGQLLSWGVFFYCSAPDRRIGP